MARLTYQIDPVHSSIAFSVRHMMVSNVRGRFTKPSGTIVYDAENPQNSSVDVVVHTASIETNNDDRNKHLKSGDFLDVENFPEMRFHSKKWANGSMIGDLTIRGVTQEIALEVEEVGPEITDPYGKRRIGGSATGKLSRGLFGLQYNAALEAGGVVVGDEVKITIDVEATRDPSK